MRIGPAQAFIIAFAIGFIIAFTFGFALFSIFSFFGLGQLFGILTIIFAVAAGIVTGVAGVFVYFIWKFLSRNQQLAIAGVLLIGGLVFFPPLESIAIVGFIFSFLGVKRGR